jgi:RNA polymerase sigma factor (sigma-70 family)
MATGRDGRRRPAQVGEQRQAGDRPADDGEDLALVLQRARDGDRSALAEIVGACRPMVTGVASRYLTGAADVEDVVQEVWLTLARNLDRIAEPRALRGWLATVATHAAWRIGRRQRRLTAMPTAWDVVADDDTEAEATLHLAAAEAERCVRAALTRLGSGDRHLLQLLNENDRPDYRAVSRATGRPVGSIGPTRQRAMARLRRDPALRSLGLVAPVDAR